MTDFLLPPDLPIANATNNLDANTSAFKSPTVGSTRTAERLGDQLRFQLTFATTSDNPAVKRQRGRMIAFLSSLRGQSARVWMTPPGATQRGSFPATELFVNNDFSGGLTGWSSDAQYSLSAIDRGIRSTRAQVTGNSSALGQLVSLSAGIPYVIRGAINNGRGPIGVFLANTALVSYSSQLSQGVVEAAFTTVAANGPYGLFDPSVSGAIATNYFDTKWMSLSRCAQVDNGVNLLLNSDTPGNGTGWTINAATFATAAAAAPDGSATVAQLVETTANSSHNATQTVTVAAAAADFTFSIFVDQGSSPRGFCWIQMTETLGSTTTSFFLNLATGVISNLSSGANWTAISTFSINYGNGWWRIGLTARKTNAATAITVFVGTATTASTSSFVGSTSAYLLTWRASLAQSSVPVQPVQTAGTAQTGTLQTGLQLNVKGLPVSTQGLLLPGDWIEVNSGQLNMLGSPLDSDGAGLGTAVLVRPPRTSPADSSGFVINNPMGKFYVNANSTAWNEAPGKFSDATIELAEDISF